MCDLLLDIFATRLNFFESIYGSLYCKWKEETEEMRNIVALLLFYSIVLYTAIIDYYVEDRSAIYWVVCVYLFK